MLSVKDGSNTQIDNRRVLLTGATGFVGSRLFDPLHSAFPNVRCASRSVERARRSHPGRDWVRLDVDDPASFEPALDGVKIVYYLVHGMGTGDDYERRERDAAERLVAATEKASVERIVYLGGVQPNECPSAHLRSRRITGEILRGGNVPCIELRAGMIIGSGSTSWQMVRDLSARLPVMVLPTWLRSKSCPVYIDDVCAALLYAAHMPLTESACYSLPGPETLSAKEILLRVSKLCGYDPITVDVPLVSPKLSSYWIQWVTRAERAVAKELVLGLLSDLIGTDPSIWELLPEHQLTSFDDAARSALRDDRARLSLKGRALEALVRRVAPKR
jgi:uncharacterized protein YbjT (DUF2867 family)